MSNEEQVAYPYREDGSIDVLELFNQRFEQTPDTGLFPPSAISNARRALSVLEQRLAIRSKEAAELAVLIAEQMLTNFSAYENIGQSFKRITKR